MTKARMILAVSIGLTASVGFAGEKSTGGIGDVFEIYPIYTLDRTNVDAGAPSLVNVQKGQRILAARHRNGPVAAISGRGGIVDAYLQSLDR